MMEEEHQGKNKQFYTYDDERGKHESPPDDTSLGLVGNGS
jgi:hypothetical protein